MSLLCTVSIFIVAMLTIFLVYFFIQLYPKIKQIYDIIEKVNMIKDKLKTDTNYCIVKDELYKIRDKIDKARPQLIELQNNDFILKLLSVIPLSNIDQIISQSSDFLKQINICG
jgi:hypothetical protein